MPTGVMFAGGKPYSEGRESIREVSPRSGLLGTMRQIALVLMPGALLVSDVLAVGVAALVIVSTTNRRRVTVVLPLLGFLVAAGLTVAINPSMAATTALGYIVIAAGLLLLLFSSTRAADAVPVAIGAALANVCVAALAVYQVGDRGAQASLLSFHPNMAAAWVLVSLGANLNGFRTIGPRPGFVRLLMITGVAAGLVALALTGSRSGLLGLALGALALGVLSLRRLSRRPRSIVIAAAALAAGMILLWQVDVNMQDQVAAIVLSTSDFEDGGEGFVPGRRSGLFASLVPTLERLAQLRRPFDAAGERVAMWILGLDLAAARPVLGYGLGSSQELADAYGADRLRRPLSHFHSLYVQILVEGGAVLFSTFILLVAAVLAYAWRGGVIGLAGAAPMLAVSLALLLQSVFDPVLSMGGVIGGVGLLACVMDRGS